MRSPKAKYLKPDFFVDSDHPDVVEFAHRNTRFRDTPTEKAVALYYAIRDGWRYNPYPASLDPKDYRASELCGRASERGGHCIDKAILLAAGARVIGVPSRMHFTNVCNHIGTQKLEATLGTSTLVFHGYAELYLAGKWVAATPAFDAALCQKLGVEPLSWDGQADAIFQAYAPGGAKFMEYLHDYGHFPSIPFDLMLREWGSHYGEKVANLVLLRTKAEPERSDSA